MKYSAGIIPFRVNKDGDVEYFVGHAGGSHWAHRNFWMFLKGGVEDGESWIDTAIREFGEETGLDMSGVTSSDLIPLGTAIQNPKKTVIAYGWNYGDIDPDKCFSNIADDGVTLEIDKYQWITYAELKDITHNAHLVFYEQLEGMIKGYA